MPPSPLLHESWFAEFQKRHTDRELRLLLSVRQATVDPATPALSIFVGSASSNQTVCQVFHSAENEDKIRDQKQLGCPGTDLDTPTARPVPRAQGAPRRS